MKTLKHLFFIAMATISLSSCEKEEIPCYDKPSKPNIEIPVEKPRYNYKKEKQLIFSYNSYGDEYKLYKQVTTVTQDNPKITISDSVLKEMSDSINNAISVVKHGNSTEDKLMISDIIVSINGNDNMFNLCITASNDDNTLDHKVILDMGRDKILELFGTNKMYGHITTFDDQHDKFRGVLSSEVKLENGISLYFYIANQRDNLASLDYKLMFYNIPDVTLKPISYLKEYKMVYDRFNERAYKNDSDTYLTKITCKYTKDLLDFDSTIKYPSNSPFNSNTLYPVVQIYENDILLTESIIIKYTEEYELDNETNRMRTNVEFRSVTLKDKCYTEICYQSYYQKMFKFRSIDFSKPTNQGDFTEMGTLMINIVDDTKINSKETISWSEIQRN